MKRVYFISLLLLFWSTYATHAQMAGLVDLSKDPGQIPYQSGVVQGATTYTVPIRTAQPEGKFQPGIALSYNSMAGNDVAGYGWTLSGVPAISITRSDYYFDENAVQPEKQDKTSAYELDGVRLVKTGETLRAISYQTETGDIKVQFHAPAGNYYFTVYYPDGMIGIFGDVTHTTPQITYPVLRLADRFGSYLDFSYVNYKSKKYIQQIRYGTCVAEQAGKITFSYQTRTDIPVMYRDGTAVNSEYLLKSISSYAGESTLLCTYSLTHQLKTVNLLTKIDCKNGTNELNPLVFAYGNNNSVGNFTRESNVYVTAGPGQDGVTDVVVKKFKLDPLKEKEGIIAYPNGQTYAILSSQGGNNLYGSTYPANKNIYVYHDIASESGKAVYTHTGTGFQDFVAIDAKGDGADYFVKVNYFAGDKDAKIGLTWFNRDNLAGGGKNYSVDGIFKEGNFISPMPRVFLFGDFIGDGYTRLFTFHGNKTPKGVTYSSNSPGKIFGFNPGVTEEGSFSLPGIDVFKSRIFAADIDGDGKTEICVISPNNTTVYTYNSSNKTFVTKFVSNALAMEDIQNRELLLGDINGDGKIDLLVSPVKNSTSETWKLYTSTGRGFVTNSINLGLPNKTDYSFLLTDINGDNYLDLVVNRAGILSMILNQNGTLKAGLKGSLAIEKRSILIPGKSNTDSYLPSEQLYSFNSPYIARYRLNGNDGMEQLMTSAVNSHGVKSNYNYVSLAAVGMNTRYVKQYPYIKIRNKMYVVGSTHTIQTYNTIENKRFVYYDAIMNRHKGSFCGFGEIVETDEVNARTTTYTYAPERLGALTGVQSPESNFSMSYNFSFVSSTRKIAKLTPSTRTEQNLLTGKTVKTTYQTDTYGNITREQLETSDKTKVITTRTFKNNTAESDYILGALTSQSVIRENENGTSSTITDTYTLNPLHLPGRHIQTCNGSPILEQEYSYTGYGECTQYRYKNYGSTNWITTKYELDYQGRIKKEIPAIAKLVTERKYNAKGELASITNHKNQTVTYEYNVWGELIKTSHPNGVTENISVVWTDNPDYGWFPEGLYTVTKTTTGQPTVKTYYDQLNREIRSSTTRFNGSTLKKDIEYNIKGQPERESLPYTGSAPSQWNSYTYDAYGRPTFIRYASGKTESYGYSGASVSVTAEGIQTTTTYDALGNTLSVEDPGGIIRYDYKPDGQLWKITAPGGHVTELVYDVYGRKTMLKDPSAGNTEYIYDNTGNLVREVLASGKVNAYTYDSYNRPLTKRIGSELTTTYTYNDEGQITSQSSANQTTTYTYDTYGRIATQKESITGGKWLEKKFTYATGALQSVVYQSQSGTIGTENYTYTQGHLTEIKLNNSISIWKLTGEDARGNISAITTGPLSRTYGYDTYGFPTARTVKNGTTVVQDFSYRFDPSTNNLEWRKDNRRNLQENFTYDDLNRLTGHNGETITYDNQGNMTQHSSIGNFTYNSQHPYTPETVVNSGNAISINNQAVTYNAFRRPATIAENNFNITFAYGNESQRVNMLIKQGTNVHLNRYYIDAYEIDEGVNGNRERLYLGGDAYTAPAVYVRENNIWTLHYICRDYLGSITHVTNSTGAIQQELSYNAWGRIRNPETHGYYKVGSEPAPVLGRGYTGHEHIIEAGVINMNARLYDPAIGRFLSPDPYVQAPYNTQNFNRYTYALNNPLKYTDESGELWGFVAGFVKGMVKAPLNPGKWFQSSWKVGTNELKIIAGLFVGSPRQIFSRLTWEFPQTMLGLGNSLAHNWFKDVSSVRYYKGATVVQVENGLMGGMGKAITLGSYIVGGRRIEADPHNQIFQHEYGHYLQSQAFGWGYLARFALTSGLDTLNDGDSNYHPVEQDANARAFNFFNKHVDGFYRSFEDFKKGKEGGWNFSMNPLAIDGYNSKPHVDYKNSEQMKLVNDLKIKVSVMDYFSFLPLYNVFGVGAMGYRNHIHYKGYHKN